MLKTANEIEKALSGVGGEGGNADITNRLWLWCLIWMTLIGFLII